MPSRDDFAKVPALNIVQQQLDACNARDSDALLATYAPDARQYTLHGELLAHGHAQMRARFLTRFAEPDLHARLLTRNVMGHIVTDLELITRNFPESLVCARREIVDAARRIAISAPAAPPC